MKGEPASFKFISKRVSQTIDLGEAVSKFLRSSDVIALVGELGTGKTVFVKGIAKGLGVNIDLVTSPSYTMLNQYKGRLIINHLDAYRLRSPKEFLDLGIWHIFENRGIALIEWADRIYSAIPQEHLLITFTHWTTNACPGMNIRKLQFEAIGASYKEIIRRMKNSLCQNS